ncbi:TonB-dependent receptor plug domain-containing protein [Massilia yuzhufengensis]|uniref:Outer membrane receptor proteins, mostly Fe transport n=1 Tax=Massilia yuzhufengensis TaxID=1164594 RepID=A0A1I1FII5_9BURK|nr:TonB-dependent receptor [Massilia yuzhufengensis]SFB99299.1 Outer membrane receptor proteins, mostly Fe transport [Massilia yuzhufengensis]
MRLIRTGSAGALLLAAHVPAFAQSAAAPVQQVVVSAAANGRERSITTAIVVGRDEILRQGDATLAEVLKRQPGVTIDATPGKPAAIRMRGMGGGYVAILLNGLPAPGDFSLESISPDLVERIEIQRAATAETSSQAMAGTINVILRRAGAAKGAAASDIKLGSAFARGRVAPQLVAQHSGREGALAYSLTATLRRHENPIAALTTEEGLEPALLRRTAWTDHQVEDLLELAPRLSWQATSADSITSQSYLRKRRIDNLKRERERTDIGPPTAFPHAVHTYQTAPLNAYADLAWTRKLDAGARLAARLSGFYTTRDADFDYRGLDPADRLLELHRVASGPTEREWTFSGSWRRPWRNNHALAAGWEFGRKGRHEYRRERQTDAGGALLRASDEHYRATVARSALFIQDEWDIDAAWSAYVGLRREDLHTTGQGNAAAPVDVDAGAWSPIFQALFKPQRLDGDTGPRDQFRLAASRTYKAPNIIQLMPRRYTVDNNNNATNPDQQGNPALRPELAFGIDLAWERYTGKDGMVSVSAFHKRIHDITLVRLDQRDGAWTAIPDNQGSATVYGIELEGRTTRGPFAARMHLARNWSRIDSVPGPDNRIEGQAAWSGSIGLDVASPARRIELGGSFTYRGALAHRSSAVLSSDSGPGRQLDLYALWKRDAQSRLRLSVADLLHQDVRERLLYACRNPLARTTLYSRRPVWRLMWEQSL